MLDNILTVGTYVLILFVLIAVGFLANKLKILSRVSVKDMTEFVMYIVTPCVIINSYSREFDSDMLKGLLITIAVAVSSFAANIIMAHIMIHDKDKAREKTLRSGVVFSNCAFMSLPLQQALLGAEGVFYGAAFVSVFQITLWTYGVLLMRGDFKNISLKKIFVNPGVISTIIGLTVFIGSVKIPFTLGEPIKYLSALNTPVPMVIVGFHLAGANLRIKGANAYITMVLRLIVSPLLMIAGLYLFGIKGTIPVACVIAASAPVAATVTMFSDKFKGDTKLAAAEVSITTLLSIITMPLMVGLAMIM